MADIEAIREAITFLARRARFETEVRTHLASKGMGEEAEFVVEHLRRRRIIDDAKLLQNLIEGATGKRAVGRERLRAQLLKRGAKEEEVEAALAHKVEDDGILDQLLRSKIKPGDSRAKAGRFLQSRGFEYDRIESALDRFFGSE